MRNSSRGSTEEGTMTMNGIDVLQCQKMGVLTDRCIFFLTIISFFTIRNFITACEYDNSLQCQHTLEDPWLGQNNLLCAEDSPTVLVEGVHHSTLKYCCCIFPTTFCVVLVALSLNSRGHRDDRWLRKGHSPALCPEDFCHGEVTMSNGTVIVESLFSFSDFAIRDPNYLIYYPLITHSLNMRFSLSFYLSDTRSHEENSLFLSRHKKKISSRADRMNHAYNAALHSSSLP